jgi:tetrahydromethanopterin S-methyltransferase subunit E
MLSSRIPWESFFLHLLHKHRDVYIGHRVVSSFCMLLVCMQLKLHLVCTFCSLLMIFYLQAVDSIGWVHGDSIVIGCVRLNEDDNEEGYLVQVIRTEESTFCEVRWSSRV